MATPSAEPSHPASLRRAPKAVPASSDMGDEMQVASEEEGRSLDLVQRTLVSLLVGGVVGKVAVVLALYVVTRGRTDLPPDSVIGLWVMSGVVGLVGVAAALLINRKRPYHPLVVLGLTPMVVAAFWLFG